MPDPLALLAAPLAEAAARLGAEAPDVALERPADESHGEYASSLALRLAKPLRRPPRELAEELRAAAAASPWVADASVAGPGLPQPARDARLVRRGRRRGARPGLRRRHRSRRR